MSLISKIYPVTCHTDRVSTNGTYVVINGYLSDGTKYIETAILNGATTVVSEELYLDFEKKYPHVKFVQASNARQALAMLSAKTLDNPANKLKIIGITGTKGKTTTAFLIDHVLSSLGYKTALFGTIKNKIGNREEKATLTTPSADTLQMYLAECVNVGVTHVIMEVSSHSLGLDRVYGIEFDVACFTNLASEHMDFYSDMESYFQDKAKLFKQLKPEGISLINADDVWGKRLHGVAVPKCKILQDGLSGLSLDIDGTEVKLSGMFGNFNAYNISMAFAVAKSLGINVNDISKSLSTFKGVPGRLQPHYLNNGAIAFVDYAHNPSSVENVLKALRELSDHLIVVMGCGGDRDKTKRPLMGRYAGMYGDCFIITDDNPRGEDHVKIAQDVYDGVEDKSKVVIELDRAVAIQKAVGLSREGSIIALLGKGHEDYYLVRSEKLYFDDFKEISQY